MPHLPCLGAGGEVHLWLCRHGDRPSGSDAALWASLAGSELERASRFHFEPGRYQYLLTRWLLRSVLSKYVPLPPGDWQFEPDGLGRPRVARAQAPLAGGLDFNLSHAHGLIALALARNARVGVDVEEASRPPGPGLAARICSDEELAALGALPPAAQADRFLALWTLKESFAKAIGMGLRMPFADIRFRFEPLRAGAMADAPGAGEDPQAPWSFRQARLDSGHWLALCASRPGPVPLSPLACRQFRVDPRAGGAFDEVACPGLRSVSRDPMPACQ